MLYEVARLLLMLDQRCIGFVALIESRMNALECAIEIQLQAAI